MHLISEDGERVLTGEEIVISGMSGLFPSSDNVTEFMENLYKNIDMVVEVESDVINPELPRHRGKVSNPEKFDAQFFKVTYKQAMSFEPMCRKMIENAYGAIYDSGINPLEMNEKKLGVFIGSSYADGSQANAYQVNKYYNQFFITGYGKTMYANRISYWINSRSPSYAVECACAGAMTCLHIAYNSILNGECDAALVGGCTLCLNTTLSINIHRTGVMCMDGKTKCFDKDGDGYVRSDTIGALFLQKAKHARRIYAQVYHTKMGYVKYDETHPDGSPESVKTFLKTFYSEADVLPETVEYVEANGVGVAEVDKDELEVIGEIFALKGNSVKIGSVKSNMGNSESASGIAALTKVCLAYHKGEIPANLHYNNPIDDVDAIRDGRIEVVKENSPFKRGFVAVNSFSSTGSIVHALLKGYYKEKNFDRYRTNIPYLVHVSGRNEECVERLLDILTRVPVDAEYIGLIHKIYQTNTSGHLCRGYAIIGSKPSEEVQVISKNFEYYRGLRPPVCFLFSGMGSQWTGMGSKLMRIPIFAETIQKCHNVLQPRGVDLINILTSNDTTIFDNVLNSFVGITAVQIGLTDILHALEIRPDYIIGHSTGEMGCAYADGCLTLEETILSAYTRGVVSTETKFIPGAMAAVGLGYNNIKKLCPPEIDVACHNSAESTTISGPAEILREFVETLKSRGIFAKEVACGNIAFHSRYITSAGSALLETLQEIIKEPRPRTSKWMSTSLMQTKWNDDVAKYSSAEYHTNNLLSPVYFEETNNLIPNDAVVIEIAPHGLLQAIVKRSHSARVNVALARREHLNPVKFLLEAIGRLYQNGLDPKIEALYPEIEFPVATGTPLLSNLIGWEHSEDWPVDESKAKTRIHSQMNYCAISLYDDEFKFLDGYTRNGINVVPEALYLVLVWKTLAMSRNVNHGQLPVKFSDVSFLSEVSFGENKFVKLKISINKGDSRFEITYEDNVIVNGYISDQLDPVKYSLHEAECSGDGVVMNSEEVYTMMNLKGYNFNKQFQGVRSVSLAMDKAEIHWTGEWVTYLDALFQLNVLRRNHEGVSIPKLIEKLIIDVKTQSVGSESGINTHNIRDVQIFESCDTIRCGAITIKNTAFSDLPVIQSVPDVLLTKQFWPHFLEESCLNFETALLIQMQIIAENMAKFKINVKEFYTNASNSDLIEEVAKFLTSSTFYLNSFKVKCGAFHECLETHVTDLDKANVLIMYDVVQSGEDLNSIHEAINHDTFVLVLENKQYVKTFYDKFCIVSAMAVTDGNLFILMKKHKYEIDVIDDFNVIDSSDELQFDKFYDGSETTDTEKQTIVLYNYKRGSSLDKLRLAKIRNSDVKANLLIIEDEAPEFSAKNSWYKNQLQKNLRINTFKQGQWGGYYYTPASPHVDDQNCRLVMEKPNDLKSLKWTQVSIPKSTSSGTVKVCYAGLSQNDCQELIFETQKPRSGVGMDFSGIDSNGDYVMGLVPGGAVSSVVNPDPDLLWPVPKHWTLQEAATIPLPYVHAYYILNRLSIRNETRVLIIGGAGGLGQALISICLSLGSTVFTTASTRRKKETLIRLFPKLDENNIICGKNLEMLYEHIVFKTKNKCCHYVISCADGKLRELAMSCVGKMGSFVDINKQNMELNNTFGLYYLLKFRSVKAIFVSNIFESQCLDEKKIIKHKIAEGIAAGVVKPLPAMIYNTGEIPEAFSLLSAKKHIGRVMIKMRSDHQMPLNVSPRFACSPKAIFVIVCLEYVLSLQVIEFLIRRGAKKFVILWTGSITGSLIYKMQCWQKNQVTVNLVTISHITEQECSDVLKHTEDLNSVKGIFIIHGKVAEDCEEERIHRHLQKYFTAIKTFDLVSRIFCKELEHFVVVNGSTQNIYDEILYSVAEKICEARCNEDLPGLAFNTDALNESYKSLYQSNQYIKGKRLKMALTALEIGMKLNYHNVHAVTAEDGPNDADVIQFIGTPRETFEKLDDNEMRIEMENGASIKDPDHLQNGIANVSLNSNTLNSLDNFISYIENDVVEVVKDPIMIMSTKLYPYFEESFEVDTNATHLVLIPGFEGHHRIFKTMCESIKIRAVAVHLNTYINSGSIQEMASTIVKSLAKKLKLNSKFYLLGYSFGVDLALEIAALLENEGYEGIVYCLDSSPDALRQQMEAGIGDLSKANLQNKVITHMFKLITGVNCDELRQEIEMTVSWDKKIELFIKRVKGLVPYSQEYMRMLIETTYNKFVVSKDYHPTYKLNSQLVLVKAKSTSINLDEGYDLGKYSKRPVKIYNVDCDSRSVPFDARVPSIINGLLDNKLLDEFDNTNTCEIYLREI